MSILAVIEVDDQGTMKLVQYGNALDEVAGKEREAEKQSGQTARQNQETGNSFEELSEKVGGLINSIITLAGAGVLGELLKESVEISARVQELGIVMAVTAKNAHATTLEYEIQVAKVKALGITSQEASNAVLQFAQANLDVAQASKVARVAQDLAVVAGMNSSQAFSTLTAAISTQHTLLLRQFGIVTGLTEIYGEYAKSIGKTVNQLDEYDKKQAFVNKILTEGEKVTGAYEGAMTSAGKQLGSMARFVEEAKEKLGNGLLPVMFQIVTTINSWLDAFAKLDDATALWITSIATGIATIVLLTGAFQALAALGIVGWIGSVVTSIGLLVEALGAGFTAMEAMTYAGLATMPWLAALAVALGVAAGLWVYFSSTTDLSTTALEKAGTETIAHQQKLEELTTKLDKTATSTATVNDQQEQYHKIAKDIIKIAPSQISSLTDTMLSYDQLARAIAAATEEEKKHLGITIDGMKLKLEAQETALTDATNARKIVEQQIKNMEAQGAATGMLRADLEKLYDKQRELTTAIGTHKTTIESTTKAIGEFKTSQDPVLRDTAAYKLAQEALNDTITRTGVGYMELSRRATILGRSMLDIDAATNAKDMENALRGLDEAWSKHEKEVEKSASAEKKAFDSMMDTMEGHKKGLNSQLSAIQAYFNKTSMSTEDWYSAVQRAKGPLEALGKASEEVQNQFSSLMPMVWSLPSAMTAAEKAQNAYTASVIKTGEEIVKFGEKGEAALASMTNSFSEHQIKLQQQIGDVLTKSNDKVLDTQQKLDDSLEKRSVELRNRELKGTQTALEAKLAANNEWYNAQQTALDKELANLDKLQKAERDDIDRKARDRSQDVADTLAKLLLKSEQESKALEEKIKNELMLARVKRDIHATEKEQDDATARNLLIEIGEDSHNQIAAQQATFAEKAKQAASYAQFEIEEAQIAGQQLLAASHDKLNTERDMIAAQRKEIERIRTISNGQILKEDSVLYEALAKYPAEFMSVVSNSLSEIVQGHKTLKEGILDIWKSIQNEVTSIFSQIVKKWTDSWVQMAMAGKSGSGGLAGMFSGMGAGGGQEVGPGGEFDPTQMYGQAGGMSKMSGAMGGIGGGVMGAGIGMTVGGMAGANGNATLGGLAGLGSGAASGAAMGFMAGGPIGAGIGAIIGGIGGLIGGIGAAHAAMKKMGEDRDAFIKAQGGIEELTTKAKAAGISIDAMLNTKKPKEFADEMKKIEEALKLQGAKDELVKQAGGMEKLTKAAELAGASIKKVFDAKTVEEFNAEVVTLNKSLEASAKLQKAGQELAKGFATRVEGSQETIGKGLKGIYDGLSEDVEKELTKGFDEAAKKGFTGDKIEYMVQQMRKVTPAFAGSAAGFTGLSPEDAAKQGEAVSKANDALIVAKGKVVDLQKAYDTLAAKGGASATELAAASAKIADAQSKVAGATATANKTLEDAQKAYDKLKASGTASAVALEAAHQKVVVAQTGVATAAAKAQAAVESAQKAYDTLAAKGGASAEQLAAALAKVHAAQTAVNDAAKKLAELTKGLNGTEVAAKAAHDELVGMGYAEEDIAKLAEVAKKAQKAFNTMGVEAQVSFATVLKSTGDINAAMEAVGPSLDALIEQQKLLGLQAGVGLQKLLDLRTTVTTNSDVAKSLSGINAMLKAMTENGVSNQEMFDALGSDAVDQMNTLKERGVDANQSMMMMQPTLQSLWEAQQKFGYVTDDATQALITQGIEQGVVGAGMQSTNDKMLDVLVLIGKTLGADIPEAYDKAAMAAKASAKAQNAALANTVAQQLVATNAQLDQTKDVATAQKVLTDLVAKYGQKWVDDNPTVLAQVKKIQAKMDDLTHATEGVSNQLDTNSEDFRHWREGVEDEAGKAKRAVEGVAVGHSPGGVREISTQLGIATRAMQVFSTVAQSESKDAEAALKGIKPGGASSRQSDTAVTGADLARLVAAMGQPQPITMTLDGRVVSETVLKRMPTDVRLRGVNL